MTWLFKKFDPGICLAKSRAQEKQVLSHTSQHLRGRGQWPGPSVCGDLPVNLPPTGHLTSQHGFQPGRRREQVPGERPEKHPLAPPGWSKVGGEPTGAGAQEMEFKAHSKEQRGRRPSQDRNAPLLSSLTHPGGIPGPRTAKPPSSLAPSSSPLFRAPGGQGEDGSEGRYRDGSPSPSATERPPVEPSRATSKAHTILHLRSRAGKVQGASRVFSAHPTENPRGTAPTPCRAHSLSFQQIRGPRT